VEIDVKASKRGAGKTVLVVDDNPAMRRIIADAFLSDGFDMCGQAENGKAGVEVAEKLHPDLITLDLSMPVMNGLETAEKLRGLLPKTPIIMFTMHGDSLSKEDSARVGIDLVLPKTVPLASLINKAHELIDK
jgi:two-component system, chemotaxis family, chemotaxis protein CheY